jgi:predicted nuclease of restriction endonuclease-like (RecB) superfamily
MNLKKTDALTPLVGQIAEVIAQARGLVRQSVNSAMVASYWEIGRLIVEHEQKGQARAAYGQRQLAELSARLTALFGKGFDVSNLRNMRRFHLAFPIRETVSLELSWSHYNALARVENPTARQWYRQEAIGQNWSVRALDRQISVLYYERLLSSKEQALVETEAREKTAPLAETQKDFLRDPYVLDFLNLGSRFLEGDLEQAIIDNLQGFLLELGKGFAFVARQQRMSVGDEDFFIDLVFYNFKLKCFLLVDLKLGRLTHQDMGQMDTYVRLYDQQIKSADDNPTIGLVLCSEKSEAVVRYSVLAEQRQLFAAKYLPHLPSEEELKRELERERELAVRQLARRREAGHSVHMQGPKP